MEWWVSMPKLELHAHLNGSIRNSTLLYALSFVSPFSLSFFTRSLVSLSDSWLLYSVDDSFCLSGLIYTF
ncbi:unnamed protein product [Cuscuta campestris]|uniref:Adenosine deaminase domain-containing protein n=1 Tax=Cuscuta campestris TaxID=132261 RepID=A0A484ML67_9ASTE|nr:unnamed protein product [Cuscuta campestris]